LNRESTLFPGADVVPLTEGNTDVRDIASAQTVKLYENTVAADYHQPGLRRLATSVRRRQK
jgi:hypothetical protein